VDDQSERRVAAEEFMDLTPDPEQARQLRDSLEQLADKAADPVLQEFAQEVLSGRVGLREATYVPAYSEALIDQTQTFRQYWDSLPESQREELAEEGDKILNGQHGSTETSEQTSAQQPKSTNRHNARGWSLY
jgi:hypothetical protein